MKIINCLLALILFFSQSLCFAEPVQKLTVQKTEKVDIEAEIYQRAEMELGKDFYRVYRIVERLSRANKLDARNWRILIPPKKVNDHEVNAEAVEANLIILNPDLVQSVDEVSVLAFVIAHEMAHETERHGVEIHKEALLAEEKISQVKEREKMYAGNDFQKVLLSSSILGSLGYYFIKDDVEFKNQQYSQEIQNIFHDFYAKKRKMEYEADRLGFEYMTRAGFNPEGMEKFFRYLADFSLSLDSKESTHPALVNRVYNAKALRNNYDLKALKHEGSRNIKNSKPLTYEKMMDSSKKFIRMVKVNSKHYSDEEPVDQFKQLFGK